METTTKAQPDPELVIETLLREILSELRGLKKDSVIGDVVPVPRDV